MQFANTQQIEQTVAYTDHVSSFWPTDTIHWRHGRAGEFRKEREKKKTIDD